MVVVDTVRAMKTKPVLDLEQAAKPSAAVLYQLGITGIAHVLQNALLPHLVAGLGILLISVYVEYTVWIAPHHFSANLSAILVIVLLGIYGIVAFGYSLLAAATFALYEACAAWEDFIDYLFDLVQERALARLENVDESLAKDQAKVLIRGSIREVVQNVRKQPGSAWPRWLAALGLGGVVLAMRSVLIARIVKWSGTTIKLSKLFAGKATLVGAIFLNLRLFALMLLGLVYGLGGTVLFLQGIFWWWGR